MFFFKFDDASRQTHPKHIFYEKNYSYKSVRST